MAKPRRYLCLSAALLFYSAWLFAQDAPAPAAPANDAAALAKAA